MSWCKLADLKDKLECKVLVVRPKWRTYLKMSDAGYDWSVGQPFVVFGRSEFTGLTVAVDEVRNLRRAGYTEVHIHWNDNVPPLKLPLEVR
ncbi:hypothetical protein V6O07_06050 [Arthrospira platensis SPKY2]